MVMTENLIAKNIYFPSFVVFNHNYAIFICDKALVLQCVDPTGFDFF